MINLRLDDKFTNKPRQANMGLMPYAASVARDQPAHPCSLKKSYPVRNLALLNRGEQNF